MDVNGNSQQGVNCLAGKALTESWEEVTLNWPVKERDALLEQKGEGFWLYSESIRGDDVPKGSFHVWLLFPSLRISSTLTPTWVFWTGTRCIPLGRMASPGKAMDGRWYTKVDIY